MTLEEIGERFDLTRERVRQIKEKAIRRLKPQAEAAFSKATWADSSLEALVVWFQAVPQVKRTESPVWTPCQSPLVVDRGFWFSGTSRCRSMAIRSPKSPEAKMSRCPIPNMANMSTLQGPMPRTSRRASLN